MFNFPQYFLLININGTPGFAFGYTDHHNNVFRYYPATLLPPGIDPNSDPNAAVVHLINQFIKTKEPDIHCAISFLKPSMKKWNHEHFVNYLRNGEVEYSSDSDDDARDSKSFSEADKALSLNILNRTGYNYKTNSYKIKPLSSRLTALVKKSTNNSVSPRSLGYFIEGRAQYFPSIKKEANQIVKMGKSEFKSELELINIAIKTKSLVIKCHQKADKSTIEISGEYNKERVNYILKGQYFLPLFRGISYLVDRWNDTARRAHRRLPIGRDPINYAEANIKTVDGFYSLDTYEKINFGDLHENARMLKGQLLKFKLSPPTILEDTQNARQFGNFLDYMQYIFSNGVDNFISHLDEFNKKFPGILPNNGNPFLPFSHLPFHAVRYAFGEKNPYKDFALPPLWDKNGRPRKPHVGKLTLSIHPLSDFLNVDEPNVVPYLTNVGIAVPKEIGAEYEVSFLSFIPKERLFKQHIIRYPSFHKPYDIKYLAKYGLTKELFEGFKLSIINPTTQNNATEVLKAWLCIFHAIKAMDQLSQEIARRQGTMLFFHPDGSLQPSYPSENYQSNSEAIRRSVSEAYGNRGTANLVLTDSQSWSRPRSVRIANMPSTPRIPLSGSRLSPQPWNLSPNPYKAVSPDTPDDDEALSLSFERQLSIRPVRRLSMVSEFNEVADQQRGWNCFDVAVGISNRQALVDYALEKENDEFRRLLAPEIMHAVAATAVYINKKEIASQAAEEARQARSMRLIEFFEIASALKDKVTQDQLAMKADALVEEAEESKDKEELLALQKYALPVIMHSANVRKLTDEYYDAYQLMVNPVRDCNTALGHPEGRRLSLEELDKFFKDANNRTVHQQAYEKFKKAREEFFTPFETNLYRYCEDENTYKTYVREYYGKENWFAFQRHFANSNETSMVDIAARMLGTRILIHNITDGSVMYETKNEAPNEIHIDYNGHNHFTRRPMLSPQIAEGRVVVGGANNLDFSTAFPSLPKPVTWLAPNVIPPLSRIEHALNLPTQSEIQEPTRQRDGAPAITSLIDKLEKNTSGYPYIEILKAIGDNCEDSESIANVVWKMIKKDKGIEQHESQNSNKGFRDLLRDIIEMGIAGQDKKIVASTLQKNWGALVKAAIKHAKALLALLMSLQPSGPVRVRILPTPQIATIATIATGEEHVAVENEPSPTILNSPTARAINQSPVVRQQGEQKLEKPREQRSTSPGR